MPVPEGFSVKDAHVVSEWVHDRPLNASQFDPQGRYVFCGSEDAFVERFQLADGAKTILAEGHKTWVQAIAFTGDGEQTISAGCDGQMTWWETAAEQPTPLRTIEAHKGWVRCLAVSPDGQLLASGGNDNLVRLWNLSDGSLIRELAGHEKHVYSVTFHPDGQFLLSGDLAGSVRQWDVSTGKEVRAFDATPLYSYNAGQKVDFGGVRGLTVSPDGKWLAAGGLHKATNPLGAVHQPLILLFDFESQKVERQQTADGISRGVIWKLTWLADGSLMGLCSGGDGGHLMFWKTDAEKDYHRLKLPHLARDMSLHPDGLQVATAHYDRKVRITRLAAKTA